MHSQDHMGRDRDAASVQKLYTTQPSPTSYILPSDQREPMSNNCMLRVSRNLVFKRHCPQRSSSKRGIIKKHQPRCSQIRVHFSLQEGSTLPMSAPVFANVVYKPYYVSGCHALQTKIRMLKLAPNSNHGKLM